MDTAGLMRLASSRFGVFTRAEAENHGFNAEAIRWKLESEQWERLRRGVYRVRGVHSSWSQSARAVLLQAGNGSALSHGTAAFLYGLDGFKRNAPRVFDVTSPREIQWSDRNVRAHLAEQNAIPTETLRGLTVTSLARTLHDLTGLVKSEPLEQALDSARRIRSLFPKELEEYLATIDQEDFGSITLRRMIAERGSPLDSAQEVIMLNEALKRGLPRPKPGYSVFHLKKFIAKVDLGWEEEMVAAMFDSYLHHSARADFDRDALQRAKLQNAGWAVVGVTKRTLGESAWTDAIKKLLKERQVTHRRVTP